MAAPALVAVVVELAPASETESAQEPVARASAPAELAAQWQPSWALVVAAARVAEVEVAVAPEAGH